MKKILFFFFLTLFSCKPEKILLENNILKMEVSTRMGTAPLYVEVTCEISPSVKDLPCLDEEWYCLPGEGLSLTGDYLSKIIIENDCRNGVKRIFSMDFTLESPGKYTIEFILKEKDGKIFARVSSYPILVNPL
jgi:hypothetical protein